MTVRIRAEFLRLYPSLTGEWYPVIGQDDLMIRFDLGGGKSLAVLHSREDELSYVLGGELVFQLDGERHTVRAGDTAYLPRGVVHTYQNFTTSDARLLIATTPGTFCNPIVELSAATPPGSMPALDLIDAIATKYGITTLGPPMVE